MIDPRALQIHTDGACYMKQGRISGCAAWVVYPEHLGLPREQIVDYWCQESTNIRMELMACAKSLQWALENKPWPDVTRLYIVTDLKLLAHYHHRIPRWKQDGWRGVTGEPIANEDLWDAILKGIIKLSKVGLRVDFSWKVGKKDEIGKIVDESAKAGAQRGGLNKDFGHRPGSYTRSMVPDGTSALKFSAAGQTVVIRPYKKKPYSGREEKISFHLFEESTREYRGKFFAYANPALSLELHRGNGHRVLFNSDSSFPQIIQRIEGVELPKPVRKKSKSS